MHFHAKEIYYIAIIIDLTLRCTWSLKLSPHLDHFNDLEGGIFAMELLEVFRRFIWIFFRVETEWSKYKFCDHPLASFTSDFCRKTIYMNANSVAVRSNRGPPQDDVLLANFSDRSDDD